MFPHNFNPNDTKYHSCCCHVKTFTILSGILEILLMCPLVITGIFSQSLFAPLNNNLKLVSDPRCF
ncbi:unnamed protein product [Thelazia callipaeda]|uniref:Ovule protein n=1 Tax=Thelazia callipaeda TaxID=103827 RepID=A0A0N5CQQ7_THECL|nr:unnamed protein product [Thelazia callipaeda]